jgi:peptidylprolyl isomerase
MTNMRRAFLILLLASSVGAVGAQTAAKPSTHSATAARPAATASRAAVASTGTKVPAGLPAAKGLVKTAFSLRYQDIKIGTGADAEPGKIFKVHYTGWLGDNGRADDGRKFDSSYDRRPPLMDKDGKSQLGDDGKPKLGEPQPITFIQGMGRAIPGFDQGFAGMKVGGKRRIFIPWQLAYGANGRQGPDAAHPGIPPRSDLIFDVELMDVNEMAMPPNHPPTGVVHMPSTPERPATTAPSGTPAQPSASAHPAAQAQPPGQPETPAKTETPAQPK